MTEIEKQWAIRAENIERNREMAMRIDEWNAEQTTKPFKEMISNELAENEMISNSFKKGLHEYE